MIKHTMKPESIKIKTNTKHEILIQNVSQYAKIKSCN